jgi:hypothetical protein
VAILGPEVWVRFLVGGFIEMPELNPYPEGFG